MKLARYAITMLTLGALLGSAALWWRSRTRSDVLAFRSPGGHLQAIASHEGGIVAFFSEVPFRIERGGAFDAASPAADELARIHEAVFDPTAVWRSGIGFKVASGTLSVGKPRMYNALRVPHWALMVTAAFGAIMMLRAPLRRRRWVRQGACRNCGYDLRESRERCPECGQSVKPGAISVETMPRLTWRRRIAMASLAVLILGGLGVLARFVWREPHPHASGDDEVLVAYRGGDLTEEQSWPAELALNDAYQRGNDPNRPIVLEPGVCWFPSPGPKVPDNPFEGTAAIASELPLTLADGPPIDAMAWHDRMVLTAPVAVHGQYSQVLASLRDSAVGAVTTILIGDAPARPATRPQPREIQDVEAKLNQIIPEIKFDNVAMEDAIDQLQEVTRANIAVDWPELEAIGIHRGALVKLRLWDVPLSRVLEALLAHAEPDAVGFRAENGIIRVTTLERLQRRSELRIYDIRPIIVRYYASEQELHEVLRAHRKNRPPTTTPTDRRELSRNEAIEEVTTFIKEFVDPDSWRDNGGSVGAMREWGGRLLIVQSPEAHGRVESALRLLYANTAPLGPAQSQPSTFPAVHRLPPPAAGPVLLEPD